MQNAPPEQKEAPRSVSALQGAKTDGTENSVKSAERQDGVKLEGNLCGGGLGGGQRGARPPPLPCLNSHNSIHALSKPEQDEDAKEVERLLKNARKMGGSASRTAYGLRVNIQRFVNRVTIQNCGFIALTFGGGGAGPSCREATKKFNSFLTNALALRYKGGMRVLERGEKRKRVHFHLLADMGRDIRTGVDVAAVQKGNYATASAGMREEYAWLKREAKRYGFGVIVNLQPVKSCDQAIANYLSKYISKHIGRRELRDRGVRLVGYWGHAGKEREVRSSQFSWNSARAKLRRWQTGEFARLNGCTSEGPVTLRSLFGRWWAHQQSEKIMALEPPHRVVEVHVDEEGGREEITLWDIFEGDRIKRAELVAFALGCTTEEAYAGLYQQNVFKRSLEFAVPVFSGQSLNREQIESSWEKTVILKDDVSVDLGLKSVRIVRQ